jgi:hypothetical protein
MGWNTTRHPRGLDALASAWSEKPQELGNEMGHSETENRTLLLSSIVWTWCIKDVDASSSVSWSFKNAVRVQYESYVLVGNLAQYHSVHRAWPGTELGPQRRKSGLFPAGECAFSFELTRFCVGEPKWWQQETTPDLGAWQREIASVHVAKYGRAIWGPDATKNDRGESPCVCFYYRWDKWECKALTGDRTMAREH